MTTKFPSPLLGYNNNVRHRGKVFHIQTEDSGVKYGHIITHLFMDGGRILKSVKTGYAEYIGNERMADIVREMMKQQHKAMFIALRDGKFDSIIEGAESASRQSFPAASVPPAAASSSTMAAAAHARAGGMTPSPTAPARLGSPVAPAVAPEELAPLGEGNAAGDLSLDIDAVERAAAVANPSSPLLRQNDDLPPPPANLFREKGGATGKYRVTAPASPRPSGPPPSSSVPAPAVARGPGAAGERRYAPTRPASIFGQARPQHGKSIFGEDLISDKSLDEVILSYLAEDLDGEKK